MSNPTGTPTATQNAKAMPNRIRLIAEMMRERVSLVAGVRELQERPSDRDRRRQERRLYQRRPQSAAGDREPQHEHHPERSQAEPAIAPCGASGGRQILGESFRASGPLLRQPVLSAPGSSGIRSTRVVAARSRRRFLALRLERFLTQQANDDALRLRELRRGRDQRVRLARKPAGERRLDAAGSRASSRRRASPGTAPPRCCA